MKKLILILALFCFMQNISIAQNFYVPPDSCLMMYMTDDYDSFTNTGSCNPDSVRVDTCDVDFDRENYYADVNKVYAKHYYIQFKYYCYPFNYVISLDDTVNASQIIFPTIKQFFTEIENNIGGQISFTLPKTIQYPDSVYIESPGFIIIFPKYLKTIEIVNYVKSYMSNNDTIMRFHYSHHALTPTGNGSVIDEIKTIYPSPVTNTLYFKEEYPPNTKIQILDLLGNILIEESFNNQINVSRLPSAMYLIKIGNHYQKFIKN